MSAAPTPPRLSFAVVGNAPDTLAWLQRVLATLTGMNKLLLDDAEGQDRGG